MEILLLLAMCAFFYVFCNVSTSSHCGKYIKTTPPPQPLVKIKE